MRHPLQLDTFPLPVWYFNLTWQSPSGMLFPTTGEKTEHPAREISILGKPNADKDFDVHPPKQKYLAGFPGDAVFKDSLDTTSKYGQRVYIEYQARGLGETEPDKCHAPRRSRNARFRRRKTRSSGPPSPRFSLDLNAERVNVYRCSVSGEY